MLSFSRSPVGSREQVGPVAEKVILDVLNELVHDAGALQPTGGNSGLNSFELLGIDLKDLGSMSDTFVTSFAKQFAGKDTGGGTRALFCRASPEDERMYDSVREREAVAKVLVITPAVTPGGVRTKGSPTYNLKFMCVERNNASALVNARRKEQNAQKAKQLAWEQNAQLAKDMVYAGSTLAVGLAVAFAVTRFAKKKF